MVENEVESSNGSRNEKTMVFHHAKIEVERFTGSNNFGMWRCEVKDALCQQDLEEVLGDKPDDIEEKVWVKMNNRACGIIRSCLAKEIKYFVMNDTSAKEIWRKLEEKYLTKTIQNQNYLLRKFYRIDMRPGISMEEHLNDFTKMLTDLVNLGVTVSDETKAVCLLNSLPDDYEHLTTTLTYGKEKMVYEEISAALLNHACMRRDKKESKSSTPEALVSRGRQKEKKVHGGQGKSRSKSRGKFLAKDECAFCHEKGHWKKDCPKVKQKDKGQSSAANVVQKDGNDSDYSLSVSSMACSASSTAEWILDSGATFHCCPLRDWFSSFEKMENAGVVLMGDDNPCKIMGVGSIRVKMFDGIVRELKNVRYVPGMKKNLISLGYLEAKGYRYSGQDGILKVSAGAMTDQSSTDQQGSIDSDDMTDEETADDTEHVDPIDEGPIATRLPKRNADLLNLRRGGELLGFAEIWALGPNDHF
ncbi:hypothetical protein V2J09_022164 [Rumex salicifolius]